MGVSYLLSWVPWGASQASKLTGGKGQWRKARPLWEGDIQGRGCEAGSLMPALPALLAARWGCQLPALPPWCLMRKASGLLGHPENESTTFLPFSSVFRKQGVWVLCAGATAGTPWFPSPVPPPMPFTLPPSVCRGAGSSAPPCCIFPLTPPSGCRVPKGYGVHKEFTSQKLNIQNSFS